MERTDFILERSDFFCGTIWLYCGTIWIGTIWPWNDLTVNRTNNWTCGQRFSMYSWHHIYTEIISFQSWDNMICFLLTSSTKLNRRIKSSFVKCLEHIWWVSPGRPSLSPLLLHEINPLNLSTFPCFGTNFIIEWFSMQNYSVYPSALLGRQYIHPRQSKWSVAEIPGRRYNPFCPLSFPFSS